MQDPDIRQGTQGPIIIQQAGKARWTNRDPDLAGRDPHPLGHQPRHQGEWAVVKETSRTQGKQPVHQGCMVITKSNIFLTAKTDGRKALLFNTDMQECQQGVNSTH